STSTPLRVVTVAMWDVSYCELLVALTVPLPWAIPRSDGSASTGITSRRGTSLALMGGLAGPMQPAIAAEAADMTQTDDFADLVGPHLAGLYGYGRRLTGQPADAEDLLQEALLRALRAHGDLRDAERVRPWLFTIVTNAWRDRQRSLGREVSTVSLDA